VNIDWKSAFLKEVGHFWQFSSRRGRSPSTIFALIDRPRTPYNFAADGFRTEKLCSRLSSKEVHFQTENGHFAF